MFKSKRIALLGFLLLAGVVGYLKYRETAAAEKNEVHPLVSIVSPQSFPVEVSAVGELEAARSTSITSSISGDNPKIIALVVDGATVNPGDVLVRIDPAPYENKIAELKVKISDQETIIQSLEQSLEWELSQAEIEKKVALMEIEAAQLESDKIVSGDGPMEISRLKSAMQKTAALYEELQGYTQELEKLEKEGFINFSEIKQAKKKLNEAQEAFDLTKLQYVSFTDHVYPMQIKKAQSQIKKAKVKQEEVIKTTAFRCTKAKAALDQSKQQLKDLQNQLRWGEHELALTEIKAPTPGMVVLRDEFRQGQRRKPRIGDLAVKNQPLLDLPDLSSLIVKSKIREVDLHKIALGKAATIQVDAYPAIAFPGKIIQIGVLAIPDMQRFGEEKYFEVQVALDQADEKLRPGMTARVVVHADEVKEKLSIPYQAVFEVKKQSYCYVRMGGFYERRAIQTGASNDQWIEVVSGLDAGEMVSLSPPMPSLISY